MRRMSKTLFPILVLAIFASASFAQSEKIVFRASYDGSDNEIYIINPDGTGLTQLTDNMVDDDMPSFSRDGTMIVFRSDRGGASDLYVMSAVGANVRRVTSELTGEKFPEFSPDGTKIVFDYHDGTGNQIAVVNSDGTGLTNLTEGAGYNQEASYSPDGTELVFVSLRDGLPHRIFRMNADGSGQTPLTDGSAPALGPSFHPSGQRILYHTSQGHILVIDRNGMGLDSHPFGGKWAVYSPDGTRVVYLVEAGDFRELFTFRMGSFENPVQVTNGPGAEIMPSWGVVPPQDTTPPAITPAVTGTLGNNDWYVSDVNVSWGVSDGESDVSGRTGCGEQVVSSDTSGITFTCTATSAGGTSSQSVTVKRDASAPTLTPSLSSSSMYVGSDEAASPNAADVMSGVASASCAAIDTSTVGSRTVQCTAADNAGNTVTATLSYAVMYRFAGFFQPVDNLPALNLATAGSSIPVKFSLNGYQGLNIFVAGSPASGIIPCDSSVAASTIEETVNAGGSSLTYDAATDRYVYVWKTERGWKGTCRQLRVRLNDGNLYVANFRFK